MSEIDAARLRANLENGFLPNRGEALALLAALEKAWEEVNEQARLNGMGGERELRLMAERNSARALLRLLLNDEAAPICRYEAAILAELESKP